MCNSFLLFLQKAPFWMFEWVLNVPQHIFQYIFLFWVKKQSLGGCFLQAIRIRPITTMNLSSFVNFNVISDFFYFEGRNLKLTCKGTVTLFAFLFSGILLILHHPFYIVDSGTIKYFFSIKALHCSTLHLDFKRNMCNVSTCFDRKCLPGNFLTKLTLFIWDFAKSFRKTVFVRCLT